MTNTDLWVFGYGSLIWQPGFEFVDRQIATMDGYARSFCMWSIHHRGTEENPGLVLALDTKPDDACQGVAFQVSGEKAEETLTYLRERELISSAYNEATADATLADGRVISALTYVVDREHVQYCADLTLERQAQVIAGAIGGRGPNSEYLYQTDEILASLGLADPDLVWLTARVKVLVAA